MRPLQPLPPLPTPTQATTIGARRVVVAEVTCLLCGRPVGTATADRWPPGGPILFQQAGSPGTHPLAAWWRLRCPVCGGNTMVSELVMRTVRSAPPSDLDAERPSGPPTWSVAHGQAHAHHSLLEASATSTPRATA